MGLITNLIEWTERVFTPLGAWGLFILSFMESSFFPIPPDFLLTVLILASPENWIFLALVATVGSVLGGMFGYGIGYGLEQTVLEKMFSKKRIAKAHKLYQKYEASAVFIGAFTPLPYKIFTITAGLFYVNFKRFIIASALGRGIRFFAVAFLVSQFGEAIISFVEKTFNYLTLIVGAIAVAIWLYYRKKKKEI